MLLLSRWARWQSWCCLGCWLCSLFHICWLQTPKMQRLLQSDVHQRMAWAAWWGNRCSWCQLGWRNVDVVVSKSQIHWHWCPFVCKLLLLLLWLLRSRWTVVLLLVSPIVVLLLHCLLRLWVVGLWLLVVMFLLLWVVLGMLSWWVLRMLWSDTSIPQTGNDCHHMLVVGSCTDALISPAPLLVVVLQPLLMLLLILILTTYLLMLVLLFGAHPDDRSRDHCSATM